MCYRNRPQTLLLPFCLVIVAGGMARTPSARADDLEKSKKQIAVARSKFEKIIEAQTRTMRQGLESLQKKARVAGNLELSTQLEDELEAFIRFRELPTSIPTMVYRKRLNLAFEQCVAAYNKQIAGLTKKGSLAAAERVEDWRNRFEDSFQEDHPGVRLLRTFWKHSIGKFEKIDGSRWVEVADRSRHDFVEVSRTPASIVLYNSRRKCRVVLTDNHCIVQFGKKRAKPFYSGEWIR